MESAVKVPIKFIVDARIEGEGNNVVAKSVLGDLKKVRIMGRVVAKFVNEDGTYASIVVDDETETIRVKFFREMVDTAKNIQPGDLVDITGRISEYQGEISILCDSCAVLNDMNWELLRKLEIAEKLLKSKEEEVLEFIRKRGKASMNEIMERWENGKELVEKLKARGDIYEPEKNVFEVVE